MSQSLKGREYILPAFDLKIHPRSSEDLATLLSSLIQRGQRQWVGHVNLNALALSIQNPRMRLALRAAHWLFLDGMSVVLLARALGLPVSRRDRATSLDWMPGFLKKAETEGWRLVYLGSTPQAGEAGIKNLRNQYPGLKIRWHHGYFDATPESNENQRVLDHINSEPTDVLFVGMGMPRQEIWVHENFQKLQATVLVPIGAFLDYHAGAIATPPRWMGRVGLEWLYRLCSEPKRLWRRYLIDPFTVSGFLIRHLFSRR